MEGVSAWDGMAHLALHVAIRTGDFELREAVIHHLAYELTGYVSIKYNQQCMMHPSDFAKRSSSERTFVASEFSLSTSGIERKNVDLDEVQKQDSGPERGR